MIIKGQARGRAKQLAFHLLRADQNEQVELFECRGTLAQDVEGALIEMEMRGKAARAERPLYHASISPEAATPLSRDQGRQAADLLEERLGFHGLPRLIVLHRKEGREHIHVVWSRIDAESHTAVQLSWNYRVHEGVARELERQFGHRVLDNSFERPRPRAAREYEQRQAERSGRPIDTVTAEITALWKHAAGAEQFRKDLASAGYVLARGDRRVFVVIDKDGNTHSLSRRIDGINTRELRKRMQGLALNELPSVAEARRIIERPAAPTPKQRFPAAAREAGHRTGADRTPLHRTVRQSANNLRVMVAFEGGYATGPARIAWSSGAAQRKTARTPSNFRARRAALIADYAGKIAQALRNLRPEEIEAALQALRSERDAALASLHLLEVRTGKRQRTRRANEKRRRSRAVYRARFRRRDVPK